MGGSWDATNVADADRRRGAAGRGRPRPPTSATTRSTIAVEKAGIIKPGSIAVLAEQLPDVPRSLIRARAPRSARPLVREGVDFGVVTAGRRRSAARWSRCRACGRGTTRSSCRCTAPTRRRTPPSRWPRSRPSSATDPLDAELVARGLRRGHLARPAGDHPAQPDDPARRGAQPARRRGDGGGAGGLLPARPR